jgi:pimeloyl-ACP methyl ester carboxylesterase
VLYPDRSFLFGVEQGVTFYRLLPRGELAVLPKCGHNTYDQKPEDYVREILAFLDRHREPGEEDGSSPLTATCVH